MSEFVDPRTDPKPRSGTPAAAVTDSPDQLDLLHRFCREGRLYDVEAWIKAGRPLQLTWQGPHGCPFISVHNFYLDVDFSMRLR